MAWYNSNWQYRKSITVDNTKVISTETDFTMLFDLSSDSDLAAKARSDGFDILFTAADEVTKLDHERIFFTSGTGALQCFIRIPTILGSSDTVIYMYYGYASSTDQQNQGGTWRSGYKGVWHLDEGDTGPYEDSSGNNNDGSEQGTILDGGNPVINGSIDLGSGSRVLIGNPTELQLTGPMTIGGWARPEGRAGNHRPIIGKGDNQYMLRASSENVWRFFIYNGSSWTGVSGTATTLNTWAHVVGRVDASKELTLWVNGVKQTDVKTYTGTINSSSNNVEIGRNSSQTSRYFDGQLDECWIHDGAMSDGEIQTMFNNQNSPSTFYSLGAEETSAELDQEGFRFRNDDGSESAATWKEPQDTDITINRNVNFRLRVLIDAADGDPSACTPQIEYKESGDDSSQWRKVPLP